jgi:hypothetical protein
MLHGFSRHCAPGNFLSGRGVGWERGPLLEEEAATKKRGAHTLNLPGAFCVN